jgi:hypothetical protein
VSRCLQLLVYRSLQIRDTPAPFPWPHPIRPVNQKDIASAAAPTSSQTTSSLVNSVVNAAKSAASAVATAVTGETTAAAGSDHKPKAAQVVTPWDVQGEVAEDGSAKEM